MNPRIYPKQILLSLFQYPNQYNQRIISLGKYFLDHQHRSIVTFTSRSKTLKFGNFKPSIFHPKSELKIKTMEQFSSESRTEYEDSNSALPEFPPVMNLSVSHENGWMQVGEYNIFAWSVSGVESCVVVKSEDMQVVFDMGIALKESVKVPNVFITHGHIDHIGAIASHVAKRSLFGMKPARYFAPPHLIDSMKTVIDAFQVMAETGQSANDVNILPMTDKEPVHLNSRFFVKAFPTVHRVASQGYIIYKEDRVLKDEYKGLEGFEVAALHRAGKDIHHIIVTPEIAYTGDTTIEVFTNPPTPDLLRVKVLITETTFLEECDRKGNNMVDKAKARGHIHLVEMAENADLFKQVGHLVLVHFSSKYSPKYICDCVRDKLPANLREKVTPGTVAAATLPTTYL